MKRKTIAWIILALLVASMLNVTFTVTQTKADSFINGLSDQNDLRNADADKLTESNLECFHSDEEKSEGGTSEIPLTGEDTWDFNQTNEWMNFTDIDGEMIKLIVGLNNAKPDSYMHLKAVAAKNGGEIVNTVLIQNEIIAAIVETPLTAVSSFVAETRELGLASYIEPNMKVQALLEPNDPYWSYQWGPRKIEADWAWNTTVGDPSVLVAVVDTGIDWDHPDLAANYASGGYDFVNNDTDPMDDYGHGTHCAGIIAAVLNNGIGIAGLAQIRVMAEKCLDYTGLGSWEWVASAIIHAVDQGADIISMSLGGYYDSELVHQAVEYAYDSGVLIVAAAGNEATSSKSYPAAYDEVIAVAATDRYDNTAWWSNFGDWIELAAPGVDIYSTVWDNGYTYSSGTSMACPHVAGVAALLWSQFTDKSRNWVRSWLRHTADDLGDPGFDVYYGYGKVNARRAVEQAPPDHDLVILDWKTPSYVEPLSYAFINTTVLNFGMNNESDITLRLLINGSLVDSASISFLASGDSTIVNASWTPTEEGLYNVTSYVVPVSGETITANNVISAYIFVGSPIRAFVLQSEGTFDARIIGSWQVLNREWYKFGGEMVYIDYVTLDKDAITYEDIAATGADVLIISSASSSGMGWEFTDSEIDAVTRYVLEGHGLIATAGTLYHGVPNNNKLAPLFGLSESITWYATGTDLLHLEEPTHPLFANIPDPFIFQDTTTALPSDGVWDSNELVGGEYVAIGHYGESAIVTFRGVVYISPWLEVMPPYYHHHLQLLYNAITWSRYQKPEHELVVSLHSPATLKPDESTLLNTTVYNLGLNNENSVELFLLIDGTAVNSTTIPLLVNGTSYTLSYLWTPTFEATYNVTAYAPPVAGEDNTFNNIESKRVFVSTLVIALFKNVDPWEYPSNEEALSLCGIPYVVFSSSDFGSVDLIAFSKVVIASDQDQTFYKSMNTYRWWFEDYVSNGGVLEIHAADWGWHGGGWVGTLPGGLQWVGYYADYITIVDPTHPVVTTPNTITDAELDGWSASVHGYFGAYPVDSRIVIVEDSTDMPAYLEFGYEAGIIVASSQTLEWAYMRGYSRILENSLLYLPTRHEHDLAVSLEAPAFLEPGDSSLLNAMVLNRGLCNETDVKLFLLINGTAVNSTTISELPTGESSTINYLWTPTAEATYNVTAYTPPVAGENFTIDNWDTKFTRVTYAVRIGIIETHGEALHTKDLDNYYRSLGHIVERITTTITLTVLNSYDVVIVGEDWEDTPWLLSEIAAVEAYIDSGKGLVAIGDELAPSVQEILGTYGISYADISASGGSSSNLDSLHPIMKGVSLIYADNPVDSLEVGAPAYYVVNDTYNERILIAGAEVGGYVLCLSNDFALYLYYDDNEIMFENIVNWMTVRHDVAITSVVPSVNEVLVGDTVDVTVVAENQGEVSETFNITAYAYSLNSTRIYLEPSNYTFDPATNGSIGTRFNVTVRVDDVEDLAVFQVCIVYKDTIINVTRWYEPRDDPEYVFYGRTTIAVPSPPEVVYRNIGPGNGSAQVGATLFPPPPSQPSFTGSGKLCILEFEITAVPPEGETYSCELAIDKALPYDTFLLDSVGYEIPAVKENGYYWLGPAAPPPPPEYIIGTKTVTDLAPGENITLIFTWDTTGVPPHHYIICAEASVITGERDTEDNTYTDGVVKTVKHPIATFTYSPLSPKPGETVIFNASASTPDGGTIIGYTWDFGDGNVTTTADPIITHAYALGGIYNVILTVTDSEGLTDSTWKLIYALTRDIVVDKVTPSTNRTYVGHTVSINVTVTNAGEITEIFEVILYYNMTAGDIIGTQTITDLGPQEQTTITFLWNTTGIRPCRNYTITAYAVPVPGETNITNNTLSSPAPVKIKMMGDVNGDGKVGMKDIYKLIKAFGSYIGHPAWNSDADLNSDGKIDMKDIYVAVSHFGECL